MVGNEEAQALFEGRPTRAFADNTLVFFEAFDIQLMAHYYHFMEYLAGLWSSFNGAAGGGKARFPLDCSQCKAPCYGTITWYL